MKGSVAAKALMLSALVLSCFTSSYARHDRLHRLYSHLRGASISDDPSYDHQNTTYVKQFDTWVSQNADIEIAPFFSPEWSAKTLTQIIQEVPDDGYVDVGTPSWSSWIGCTDSQTVNGHSCEGCSIEKMRNKETFPIWGALLNAVHRGVKVRILTNNWGDYTCEGQIAPLDFLALNGIEIKYYRTTTIWHTKYINANGKKLAVSSVNFSYTSFLENREAGFVVSGNDIDSVRQYIDSVFEYDWKEAVPYSVRQHYSHKQMQNITDPSKIPVTIPYPSINGSYTTPEPQFHQGPFNTKMWLNPDTARQELFNAIESAQTSFQLYIYEITDMDVCYKILDRHAFGVNVSVLVSNYIVGHYEWEQAKKCYEMLNAHNCRVRESPYYYSFAHQKFWVIDGNTVGLSTGNFASTDLAFDLTGNHTYPPYPNPNWQHLNRDINIQVESQSIAEIFKKTFNEDWWRGDWW